MLDLNNMSLKELLELRNRVDRSIAGFEERRRREAMAAIEEAAREHGFSLNELTGAKQSRRGGKIAPKYMNPDDGTQTWTGRGRRPHWIQAALNSGKTLSDLEI
ncbi:H-NS histone family protein [Paracoccus albus]|uniref:H-NS histone family protein n=1 Tax=Paracoccus albus TaxID=3017784 RepID=UPI0022EFF796|nr:H-NS histone family protein [Paracoccus albus]WBU60052.1 H-NS histone family protein [Paracoccus albus]